MVNGKWESSNGDIELGHGNRLLQRQRTLPASMSTGAAGTGVPRVVQGRVVQGGSTMAGSTMAGSTMAGSSLAGSSLAGSSLAGTVSPGRNSISWPEQYLLAG